MMPLGEQLEIFEENAEQALQDIMAILETYSEAIIDLARERLTDGFDIYGDTMWNWDGSMLMQNIYQELADAVCYQVSEYR